MNKNFKKTVNNVAYTILNAPGRALVKLGKLVSPFKVENQYIRGVYRKNINLFRLHLLVSLLIMAVPVVVVFTMLLGVAFITHILNFFVECVDDLKYEVRSVYRPIVRGFKEGLPRD